MHNIQIFIENEILHGSSIDFVSFEVYMFSDVCKKKNS